ncbi:hypothetical protein AB0K51_27135 [Kitasatospora sp. NPDC049285]|uniref:hypothetical protein n=1 Tax=Kitasatospora sp. NPDC049285 TaxID=3157096 RepID=UPI003422F0D0
MKRPNLLYVTDLSYPAQGRRYGDEDTALAARLREDFDLALCHPLDAAALMDAFDAVVVRNSGPVLNYPAEYAAFRAAARERGTRVYNEPTGRGDMAGKQYLLDLTAEGLPVIPTVDRLADLDVLGPAAAYAVKPRLGADSIGLVFATAEELPGLPLDGMLIQPRIPLRYEVSFYYLDRAFQYALYAPDPARRWELAVYDPTAEDLAFADRIIAWNTMERGIQRVDACRTPEGALLLVELEDLNPYLSLDLVPPAVRESFTAAFKTALHGLIAA